MTGLQEMTKSRLELLRTNEDGNITLFGIFMIVTCAITGGLAMDVMNGVKTRTHLQVAADSAAHAALMARSYGKTENEAIQFGLTLGNAALATSGITDTLQASDIVFGKWDTTNQVFTPVSNSDDAVFVDAQRLASRSTAMPTGFLSLIGVDFFNVRAQSVFETYIPTCTREGFFAEDRVDVQSGNDFTKGFCIHSNLHVEMNIDNDYASNVIVSMPNETDVVVPNGDYSKNPGLDPALRDGAYAIPILYRIEEIINNIHNPASPWFRGDYLDIDPLTAVPAEVVIGKGQKMKDIWVEGAIHRKTCNGPNQAINFEAQHTFLRGVLVTNCKVSFKADVQLIDVAVATTNTAADSIDGSAKVTLGLDDGCADGGGAQLVTMGGIKLASTMEAYGAQMLALGDVIFTANANGVEGISIVAGGEIDSTSGIKMAFCNGAGMSNNFIADYFRMAI